MAELSTAQERREAIYADISAERQHQDQKWGGIAHDVQHTEFDWLYYIDKKVHQGYSLLTPRRVPLEYREEYRRRMIQIAALAVAAIEAEESQG